MDVNRNKTDRWKEDISKSVDFYNQWFLKFAPKAFRDTRIKTTEQVEKALALTGNLTNISPDVLKNNPTILPTLRMSTCPPIAQDRLIGLSGVTPNLVKSMEEERRIPPRMESTLLLSSLEKIGATIKKLADPDLFVWIGREKTATKEEIYRASTIVADRLCGAEANPIIRNAQEKRQLAEIKKWLETRGYQYIESSRVSTFHEMPAGTFSFRYNVPVTLEGGKQINIPIDAVIMKKNASAGDYPLFFEAKSAGDFTNVNKRRKEEATKIQQLRRTYGDKVSFNLFLCGYFDSGYLGVEASELIDWVWEHRIDDLAEFGL